MEETAREAPARPKETPLPQTVIFENTRARATRIKKPEGTEIKVFIQTPDKEKTYRLTHHRFQTVTRIKRNEPKAIEASDTSKIYEVEPANVLSHFSETTAVHLMEMADTLIAGEKKSHHLLCVGPTGTGKSVIPRSLAYMADVPLVEMNFNEDVTTSSLYWREVAVRNEQGQMVTRKVPSALVEAMRMGIWFLGNEVNTVEQDIMPVIFQAIDTGKLILSGGEGGNQVINVHPEFRFIGTMNEGYQGTVTANEAFKARLNIVEMGSYPDDEVKEILGRKFFGQEYEDNGRYQNLIRLATDEYFFTIRDRFQKKAADLGVNLPLDNYFTIRKYEDFLRVWLETDLPLEAISEVFFEDLLECVKAKNLRPQLAGVLKDFLDEQVPDAAKTRQELLADWDWAKNEVVETERYVLSHWEKAGVKGPVLVTAEDLKEAHFDIETAPEKPPLKSIMGSLEAIVFPNQKRYLVLARAAKKEGRYVGHTQFRIYELLQNKEKIISALEKTPLDPSLHEKVATFYLVHQMELAKHYWGFIFESKSRKIDLASYLKEHLPDPIWEEVAEILPQEEQKKVMEAVAKASSQRVSDPQEKSKVVRELESKYGLLVYHPVETAPEDLKILETLTESTYQDVRKIISLLAAGNFVLLTGETRVGKSSLARTAAHLCDQPLVEIPATGEETWGSLGESMRLDPEGLRIDERIVVECATRGLWLLLNEGNMLYPGVQSALNQLKDGRVITLRDGTPRKIHPNFRLIVTANLEEAGAAPGEEKYAGVKPWNEAFRNRLEGFEVKAIPAQEELALLEHHLPGFKPDHPLFEAVKTWLLEVNRPAYERSIDPVTRSVIDWDKIAMVTQEIVHEAKRAASVEKFWEKIRKKHQKLANSLKSHLIVAFPKVVEVGLIAQPN